MYALITRITPETAEPPPSSVVMRDGLTGTAFQRFESDGLFHSVGGVVVSFDYFRGRAANERLAGDFIIFDSNNAEED